MGSAKYRHHVPARRLPSPTAPAPPVASEHRIPAGVGITARWPNLQRYCGVEVGIANVGAAPCEFDGREGEVYVVRPGKTVIISLADGLKEFSLALRSTTGTRVRLAQVGSAAPPPRRTLGMRKIIERDPRTHTISSITEVPCWVIEAPG
jgi:hypothetical protein